MSWLSAPAPFGGQVSFSRVRSQFRPSVARDLEVTPSGSREGCSVRGQVEAVFMTFSLRQSPGISPESSGWLIHRCGRGRARSRRPKNTANSAIFSTQPHGQVARSGHFRMHPSRLPGINTSREAAIWLLRLQGNTSACKTVDYQRLRFLCARLALRISCATHRHPRQPRHHVIGKGSV